jgi:two-component system LytT family sensor kinase
VATFAVLSFLTTELNALLFGGHSVLRPYDGPDRVITIPADALRRAPVIYSLIPIVPTALLCVVGFNLHWWRIHKMQGRERELRDLAVSAQLAALRAQVNPHFFFNSLNSIAQLISTDPPKAEACVERLAEIFRYMLRQTQGEFVPLAEELQVSEAYLDIERARFGDDLVVQEDIDERARSLLLPGLILQPLVENAVKHGISRKIGGGSVLIRAALEDGSLRLTVRDTGVGIRAGEAIFERGVGLRNVRDRLVRLYGPTYAPEITGAVGEGTTVSLRIPVAGAALGHRAA